MKTGGIQAVVVLMLVSWVGVMAEPVPDPAPAEIPAEVLEQLRSEVFQEREAGELELLAWARRQPELAMDRLYGISRGGHPDPEVRGRCTKVLRELVADEYLREGGEGFVGITMLEQGVAVPGDALERQGIRVTQVVPGTPADKAGIVMGDLIVGMGELVWRDVGAVFEFSNEIKRQKPGTQVILKVLRNDQVEEVPVLLARRPPGMDPRLLMLTPEELMEADRAAKERFFRQWMDRRNEGE